MYIREAFILFETHRIALAKWSKQGGKGMYFVVNEMKDFHIPIPGQVWYTYLGRGSLIWEM